MNTLYVIKRKGNREEVSFDKIVKRISWLSREPYMLKNVNVMELAKKVIEGLVNDIKTSELDIHAADLAASMSLQHRDYLVLASRIVVSNHHKNTLNSFKDKMTLLYLRKDVHGNVCSLINDNFYKFVEKNQAEIDKYIDYSRDYAFDFFGFKTLEKSYLLRVDGAVIERPQDMFMRVAIQIHMPDDESLFKEPKYLQKIFHTYDMMSNRYYTHATPTLFNAGTNKNNLSSCFLLGSSDSLEGIMKTLADCARISKWSGGIGVHMSMWRAKDSLIRGTNGVSNGIVPFLRQFNVTARAFNQGGKRKANFALYLEPHHPDIMDFLSLKLPHGDENLRCRDSFTALWISDLFMERVKNNEMWSTFCPDECPGLNETWGGEYRSLYLKYESEGKARKVYKAVDIWYAIFESLKASGVPYMCYKDTVNKYSMQNNVGTIASSNLCAEINLYSDASQYAVCNLLSICLPQFVEDSYSEEELLLDEDKRRVLDHEFPLRPRMNYKKLAQIAADATENLNNVIDKNFNPVIETARSNFMHRPIGIGIQGLADVFLKFRVPFESEEARMLNKRIAEAIYYGALSKSTEICRNIYLDLKSRDISEDSPYVHEMFPTAVLKEYPALANENVLGIYTSKESIPKDIGAYPSYKLNGGSPLYNGKFHWELYGLTNDDLSGLFDWETLRAHIKIYGVRNSLTTAYMPTANTSQVMNNSISFEPYAANVFTRNTLAGDFTIINKYLMKDLSDMGLWNEEMKSYLLLTKGSIQNIDGIPQHIKDLYKTSWEIKQKSIMNLAADRQPFIDQSQSMNLNVDPFDFEKFTAMQFYAWEKKLKTGSYYTRTQAAATAENFTVPYEMQKSIMLLRDMQTNKQNGSLLQSNEHDTEETCLLCSS